VHGGDIHKGTEDTNELVLVRENPTDLQTLNILEMYESGENLQQDE
jgi:hypothetical protein